MGANKRLTPGGARLMVAPGVTISRIEIQRRREEPEWSRAHEDAVHALALAEQDLLAAQGLESPFYSGARVLLVSVLTPRVDDVLARLLELESAG